MQVVTASVFWPRSIGGVALDVNMVSPGLVSAWLTCRVNTGLGLAY